MYLYQHRHYFSTGISISHLHQRNPMYYCFGNSTGAATVTAKWEELVPIPMPGSAAPKLSNYVPNIGKTVTVTDANSCTTTAVATLTQPAAALPQPQR